MASAFTHGLVGAAFADGAGAGVPRRRLALVLAALSALPDVDVVGFYAGIPYGHPLGHRGLTHSLVFALLLGLLAPFCCPRVERFSGRWWRLAALGFLAVASHGALDAMTDAGLGIGFLLPFSDRRFFFPWRPLATSPLSPAAFFSGPALRILANEALWVWLPLFAVLALVRLLRLRRRTAAAGGGSRGGSSA